MEDILYKNSATDIRIREMANIKNTMDFSVEKIKKIIVHYTNNEDEQSTDYTIDVTNIPLEDNIQLGNNIMLKYTEIVFDNSSIVLFGEFNNICVKSNNDFIYYTSSIQEQHVESETYDRYLVIKYCKYSNFVDEPDENQIIYKKYLDRYQVLV